MAFTRSQASSILAANISANSYIGLSTTTPTATGGNFTEPSRDETGYTRPQIGTLDTSIQAQVANKNIIFFNETLGDGYGVVTHFGIFNSNSGGTPFFIGELSSPMTIGAGYVPIFRAHQLVIGLDKEALETYA